MNNDIIIDFFNGITSSNHLTWDMRKALYDNSQADFTFEFRFSAFKNMKLYDLQFRRYG